MILLILSICSVVHPSFVVRRPSSVVCRHYHSIASTGSMCARLMVS
jgi:hypothetical protein